MYMCVKVIFLLVYPHLKFKVDVTKKVGSTLSFFYDWEKQETSDNRLQSRESPFIFFFSFQLCSSFSCPFLPGLSSGFHTDYGLTQLEKLLVLLLGCAVTSEPLVEKMKLMDPTQQKALVPNIKQVTHSTDLVCSIDWDDLNEVPLQ